MEYGITAKPSTLENPMSNGILERIHQVLGNLVRTCNITQTYVDEYDSWSGILSASAFAITSTTNRLKGYSPGQLIFDLDMILPVKHTVNWSLIRHQKQAQINIDNIRKSNKIFDHDCKVRDKGIITTNAAKYIKLHITDHL